MGYEANFALWSGGFSQRGGGAQGPGIKNCTRKALTLQVNLLSILLTIGPDLFQCKNTFFNGITCLAGTTVEIHWACHVTFDIIQPFRDA